MIYLNNAATTFPKPTSVVDAVNRYLQRVPFHALRSSESQNDIDPLADCRQNLAKLFNVPDPSRILFTSSATHSLNLILRGVLKANDHVITTWTEHNSVLRLLKTLEQDRQIALSLVPCDSTGRVDPDDIKRALTPKTAMVVINHASNVTGTVQDIFHMGQIVSSHGAAFVVDGSQSAGVIDVNVTRCFMDAFVFTGHKALFGMQGTGGFYISERLSPSPLIVGGTGVKSDYLLQPPGLPDYYEAGTPNAPGIVSLNAGVRFVMDQGVSEIQKKQQGLKTAVLGELLDDRRLSVYGGRQIEDFSTHIAVIAFNIRGFTPEETGYILQNSFDIVCRSGLHCAPLIHQPIGAPTEGCVRISLSCMNEPFHGKTLIDAVRTIASAS